MIEKTYQHTYFAFTRVYDIYCVAFIHIAHGKWEGWARKPVNHIDYMFHSC